MSVNTMDEQEQKSQGKPAERDGKKNGDLTSTEESNWVFTTKEQKQLAKAHRGQ